MLRWSTGAAAVGALGATGATVADLVESGPSFAARRRQDPSWPVPPVVTRAEWGADEHLRKAAPDYDSVVEKLIVHHTVTPNGPRDPDAVVRSIMAFHTSREYIDIAYNFLIDEHGRIYEGRWARDYPPGVPHTTESRWHRQVRGAHTLHFNNRTIGVALLGTFTHVPPPQPMLHGLIELLAWKFARWGHRPAGPIGLRRLAEPSPRDAQHRGSPRHVPNAVPGQPDRSLVAPRAPRRRRAARRPRCAAHTPAPWTVLGGGA